MELHYYTNNGTLAQVDLIEGANWSSIDCSNEALNTIFQKVDDGDDIISKTELIRLQHYLNDVSSKPNETFNDVRMSTEEAFSDTQLRAILSKLELKNEMYYRDILVSDIVQTLQQRGEGATDIGFDTTVQTYKRALESITPENVYQITEQYSLDENAGLLISDIMDSSLSEKDKIKYSVHVINQLIKYAQASNIYVADKIDDLNNCLNSLEMDLLSETNSINSSRRESQILASIARELFIRIRAGQDSWWNGGPRTTNIESNGKIDGNFAQGYEGDCWLLASIQALALKPKGLELLNNSIQVLDNGDIKVTLKGVNKEYTITAEELRGNIQLSTGDLDIRAIEIAVAKYFRENPDYNVDLNGNHANIALQILTGISIEKSSREIILDTGNSRHDKGKKPRAIIREVITDTQIDNFNNTNHIATVSSHGIEATGVTLEDGSIVQLISSHAYTVSHSDAQNVYLINPHDTSKIIPVPRDTFKQFFTTLYEMDLV